MNPVADEKPSDAPPAEGSVAEQLYTRPGKFDFYQAVSLLEADRGESPRTRRRGPAVRFETPPSTAFPAAAIDEVCPAQPGERGPRMTVAFFGLTGPSGVLPRHYTEQVIRVERRLRGAAKRTLRAWFDLFNNRLIGQLYRAWASRRIDRGAATRHDESTQEPDAFSNALSSLIGLGQAPLAERFRATVQTPGANTDELVDRLPDHTLLRHAGTLSRRQRSAAQIGALLSDMLRAPVEVLPFRGQWLEIDPLEQSRLGQRASTLGIDAVLGQRVWDVQSRVRLRVGPLSPEQFESLLPDTAPGPRRRPFAMLCQAARFALGPELDFDVQLVLQREGVRPISGDRRARLGWDSWLVTGSHSSDGDEPVFEPIEATHLG